MTESLLNLLLIELNVILIFVIVVVARLMLRRWAVITLFILALAVALLGMLLRQ